MSEFLNTYRKIQEPFVPAARTPSEKLFNQQRLAQFVGLAAIGLPVSMFLGAQFGLSCFHTSISHFYYSQNLGTVFVGLLFAVFAVVLGYQGQTRLETFFAKLVAVAALGVALFPTSEAGCTDDRFSVRAFAEYGLSTGQDDTDGTPQLLRGDALCPPQTGLENTHGTEANCVAQNPRLVLNASSQALHIGSAIALFALLIFHTLVIFPRLDWPAYGATIPAEKLARNRIYYGLGAGMVCAGAVLLLGKVTNLDNTAWWDAYRITFWMEGAVLILFGISWGIKGKFGYLPKSIFEPTSQVSQ